MSDFTIDSYVYNELKNGRNIEAVAKEVTESMNSAIKTFQEEEKKARRNVRRIDLAQDILNALKEYLGFMYPDFDLREMEKISAEDYANAIDEVIELANGIAIGSKKIEDMKKAARDIKNNISKMDPLTEFLRENGLK